MITFGLRDEAFLDYLDGVKYAFNSMIETMKQVADKVVMKNVQMRTPVETGELSRSFKWTVVTDNSRMKVLEVQMSALNERTGYDYAMTQHRGYHYSKLGKKVVYHHGVQPMGFYTHSSNSDGGYDISMSSVGSFIQGESHYMYKGIMDSEQTAFQMLERDYLSLFEYGGIF